MKGIQGSVGAIVVFLSASGAIGAAKTDDRTMQAFTRRVDAYLELRREIVPHVPPLAVSSDWKAIQAASETLAEAGVSIESFLQKPAGDAEGVPIVLTTHAVAESVLLQAIERIAGSPVVLEKPRLLRIARI